VLASTCFTEQRAERGKQTVELSRQPDRHTARQSYHTEHTTNPRNIYHTQSGSKIYLYTERTYYRIYTMSIAQLLQAAEYLERRERGKGKIYHFGKGESFDFFCGCHVCKMSKLWACISCFARPKWRLYFSMHKPDYLVCVVAEAEHGYASTMPMPEEMSRRRIKLKKSQGNR